MSSNFVWIKPKNKLNKDIKIKTLISKIIERVGDIPQYHEYRGNQELLKLICSIVENEIDNKKNKVKIDKKDIVMQCYVQLFNDKMTPTELKNIGDNIEFMHENGLILKRVGCYVKVYEVVKDWIIKKFN